MDSLDVILRDLHLDDDGRFIAGPPPSDGWVRLADVSRDRRWIEGRWTATLRHAEGLERVAASYQASWLAYALVVPVARALVFLDRAWTLDPTCLWLHPADGGWYDGLSVEAVPVAGERAGELADRVAAEIVMLMTPLYANIHRCAGLGTPSMWGSLADAIGGGCVAYATARGIDPVRSFAGASDLIAAIGRWTRLPRVRPALIDVSEHGGVPRFEVRRGTCCLWYRTQPDPDPCGEGFCEGCPRRDLADQRRRWLDATG